MTDDQGPIGGTQSDEGDLIEIDLNFESMRRFQAEFSPNLSRDGLFIDTGEPLSPGSVVRFRVILPEDFVFLEGTSVVEWVRSAEAGNDGPPGMALRFVTLSPQNQELVEQLVQDHVDNDGTPFDLDVRPVPSDFPTDALEGAPIAKEGPADEGYRLTVRRTEPAVPEEALRALAEASPISDEEGDSQVSEQEAGAPEEPHGFEIVSGPVDDASAAAEVDELEGEDWAAPVADPPEIDWSSEEADVSGDDDAQSVLAFDAEEPVEETAVVEEERTEDALEATIERPLTDEDLLPAPSDFDDGPEVMGEVDDEELGSPAFDVSLPEHDDDEPDTTPVLPDEGRDDVTVHSDDDEPDTTPVLPDEGGGDVTVDSDDDPAPAPRRRPLWPYALAVVFIIALAIGFLWPRLSGWLASRSAGVAEENQVASMAGSGEMPAPAEAEPVQPEPEEETPEETSPAGGEQSGPSGESGDQIVEPAGDPASEPDPAPASSSSAGELAAASAIASIRVEPGGEGSTIGIRANGTLGEGTVSMESLPSPPRILIRLRGIRDDFKPYVIEAGTTEVDRVRIGLHDERRPPELWVVVDLAGAGFAVQAIDIRGDAAEIKIGRP